MFQIFLTIDDNISQHNERIEYGQLLFEVIMNLCDCISEFKCARFYVVGFADLQWNVDVRTDLSTVLTELLENIKKLKKGENVNIDFYEQGVERSIAIQIIDEYAFLSCTDLDGNAISSVIERMPIQMLIDMLLKLIVNFIIIASKCCYYVNDNRYFNQWRLEVEQLLQNRIK